MGALAFHQFADLFPLVEGADFEALCEDIRQHGVRDQIVVMDRAILDGRNRYRALQFLCESGEILGPGWGHRAGEPLDRDHLLPDHAWFRKFNRNVDGDPLAWVISKNLKRRHLDESQRAMVAATIATMSVGRPATPKADDPAPEHIPPIGGISTRAAAAMVNVGDRSVERAKTVLRDGVAELQHAVRQGEIAVSAAEKIARLPVEAQPEAVAKALPNGARALMGSRHEPDDSLDYFPTPPWATRAFFRHVLPVLGVSRLGRVREPSCGEGHMSGVVLEYEPDVIATDIHDYSADGRSPPGWAGVQDFLSDDAKTDADWFFANPPFAEKAELFTLKMIAAARVGVAVFARVQWLDTIGRYERIFSAHPPTLMAFFAERVPLVKGRWDPEASTATAYMWLVWMKDAPRLPPMWIPPGQRVALSYPDDVARFTAHPVMPFVRADESLLAKWGNSAPLVEAVEAAKVIGTAGDYAILSGPSFVPRDFLTEQEARSLLEFEQLPEARPIDPLNGPCCDRHDGPLDAVVALPDGFRLGQSEAPPAPVVAEHGRQPARADDDLEIPAFLRRNRDNVVPHAEAQP